MASIRERTLSNGETTWSVLFRHNGKQTSEPFTRLKAPRGSGIIAAEEFKSLVETLGPEEARRRLNREEVSGLTVDELFEKWIEWKAGTEVTARTIKDYRRDYDNWIKKPFGHRHAEAIDELDVQKWIDSMVTRKLDPKSIGDRHMILSGMFKYGSARSRRLVSSNPCLETALPTKKRKAPKGFSLAQWDAIHAWAGANEKDADDLLTFLAWTGWRFSEATPLTPRAIDDRGDIEVEFDGRRLLIPDVHVAVLGVHRVDENYQVVFAEGVAKSRAGMRTINLPPEAAAVVRRRMVGRGDHDLIFTNSRGKRWHAQNFLQREFARILEGAQIEKVRGMGPHYLRHTHVAMLDRAKVGPSSIQRRIGHENINTTFGVYGGMIGNALSPEELVRLDAVASPRPVAGAVVSGDVVVRGELGG
ncbi:tyrosine-type recombinase/integrase [Nocardioides aromaticivorans]|uniref:tyrosine-type recombinase/integrase n=1 Tax=Nocardioides aromaticivorans TaxID=200618 RepID=UPI001A902ADA|nr:tyrosine-type recombinase/integrase [Nocardioides aromaticivorans]